MTDEDRFVAAIAMTESRGDRQAWGDGGRAMGQYQVHPEFIQDYLASQGLSYLAGTWDDIATSAVRWFYRKFRTLGFPDGEIAMRFHLGNAAVKRGQWDTAYYDRFQTYLEEGNAPPGP